VVRSSYKNLRWYLPEGAKDGSLSSCPKGSPMFVRQRPRARPGDASPRDLSHEGPLHTSSTRPPLPPDLTVRRQNSVRREVVDLPALIRRRSWFDDHPPAPAASPSALSLRRPPPARPRKPRLAPAARRLQANGAPAEATHD